MTLHGYQLKNVVDDILVYLEASESQQKPLFPNMNRHLRRATAANERHHLVTPKEFDGALPLGTNADEDPFVIGPKDLITSRDKFPIWPVDAAWTEWRENDPEAAIVFHRFATAKPSDMRKVIVKSATMAQHSIACVSHGGARQSARADLALVDGEWVGASGPVTEFTDWERFYFQDLPPIVGSWVALQRRHSWSVLLGYTGTTRIRLTTDPIGLRDVFKLRDAPPGKQRRAALKHWVTSHWRRKRDDPEAKAWVHRHLRGADSFIWEGLRCAIEPALYDLEQIQKGIA